MCTESKNIIDLIHRELSGNISERDKVVLLEWMAEDSKNKATFNQYRSIWDAAHTPKIQFNSDRAYNKMLAAIEPKKVEPIVRALPKKNFNFILRIAAIVVFVIGAIFIFKSLQDTTFSAGDTYVRIDLEDGTHIWLSPTSKLTITDFSETKRNVILEGEAFFNVAKNAKAPFKIDGKAVDVEVLGTVFKMNGSIGEVDVKEGKVKVVSKEKSVLVTVNQKTELKTDGTLTVTESGYTTPTWLDQSLTFDNERLSTVLAEIELKYNVNFQVSENVNLNECRFSSSSLSDNTFDQILETLKLTFEMDIKKIDGNTIMISSLNCH